MGDTKQPCVPHVASYATWATFLLLLCMLCSAHADLDGVACEESGICSFGQTKPFFGNIYNSDVLRGALAARSYKKEVIIMMISSSQILPMIQVTMNLRSLGMEHILVMSTDEEECNKVAKYLPGYGCVWSQFRIAMPMDRWVHYAAPMWHTRWRTLARAVRLGYNVMCTDTDVIFFDDPYRYFKSEPFKDFVVINQAEAIWDQAHYSGCDYPNGGIVYVQNASPTGPGAWLITEIAHRLLRFLDSDWASLIKAGGDKYCNYIDQDCFRDALYDSRAGNVLFYNSLISCMNDTWVKAHDAEYHERWKRLDLAVNSVNTMANTLVDIPEWMVPVAGENKVLIRHFDMRMPHIGKGWDESMGGNCYGEPGNLSAALYHQLKRDCQPLEDGPDCPMWPNPEDPAAEKAARAVPTEKFLFAPPFLMFGYYTRGRLGYWIPEALGGGPVQQVIGHLHYNPAAEMALTSKLVARMTVGQFDWQASHELHAAEVYRMHVSAHKDKKKDQPHQPNADDRVPLLVALHPSVRLDRMKGILEFQELIIGLSQVAELTGRTMVFPDITCAMPWMVDKASSTPTAPLNIMKEWFPRARPQKKQAQEEVESPVIQGWEADSKRPIFNQSAVKQRLMCMWSHISYAVCLQDHHGMLHAEFEHVLEHYRMQLPLRAGRSNTFLTLDNGNHLMSENGSLGSQFLVITEDEVKKAAAALTAWRVIYVGHPVQVRRSSADLSDFSHFNDACPALNRRHVAKAYSRVTTEHDIKRMLATVAEGGKLVPTGAVLPDIPASTRRSLPEVDRRSVTGAGTKRPRHGLPVHGNDDTHGHYSEGADGSSGSPTFDEMLQGVHGFSPRNLLVSDRALYSSPREGLAAAGIVDSWPSSMKERYGEWGHAGEY